MDLSQNQKPTRKSSQGSVQQSSNLKQSLVNRTIRMQQQRPKEYTQLKMEQKAKLQMNELHQPLPFNSTLLNSGSVSVISNQKSSHHSNGVNVSATSVKQKALSKHHFNNLQSSSNSPLLVDSNHKPNNLQSSKSSAKLMHSANIQASKQQ